MTGGEIVFEDVRQGPTSTIDRDGDEFVIAYRGTEEQFRAWADIAAGGAQEFLWPSMIAKIELWLYRRRNEVK